MSPGSRNHPFGCRRLLRGPTSTPPYRGGTTIIVQSRPFRQPNKAGTATAQHPATHRPEGSPGALPVATAAGARHDAPFPRWLQAIALHDTDVERQGREVFGVAPSAKPDEPYSDFGSVLASVRNQLDVLGSKGANVAVNFDRSQLPTAHEANEVLRAESGGSDRIRRLAYSDVIAKHSGPTEGIG